jgi:hypothetical protein
MEKVHLVLFLLLVNKKCCWKERKRVKERFWIPGIDVHCKSARKKEYMAIRRKY